MKEKNEYGYRMYCFVERHLSPLDKGIQVAHSIVEYHNEHIDSEEYSIWANRDKTIIVLNGGTVKDLRALETNLKAKEIPHSFFIEEDLNNAMTCVSVLVDDRVFDKSKHPDFAFNYNTENPSRFICMPIYEEYQSWLETIGGENNCYLRELLSKYHLAR